MPRSLLVVYWKYRFSRSSKALLFSFNNTNRITDQCGTLTLTIALDIVPSSSKNTVPS